MILRESNVEGNFKRILINILNATSKLDSKSSLERCISERLNSSFNDYYKNLIDTCDYVIGRSPLRMIKLITKEFKEGDTNE